MLKVIGPLTPKASVEFDRSLVVQVKRPQFRLRSTFFVVQSEGIGHGQAVAVYGRGLLVPARINRRFPETRVSALWRASGLETTHVELCADAEAGETDGVDGGWTYSGHVVKIPKLLERADTRSVIDDGS